MIVVQLCGVGWAVRGTASVPPAVIRRGARARGGSSSNMHDSSGIHVRQSHENQQSRARELDREAWARYRVTASKLTHYQGGGSHGGWQQGWEDLLSDRGCCGSAGGSDLWKPSAAVRLFGEGPCRPLSPGGWEAQPGVWGTHRIRRLASALSTGVGADETTGQD